MITANINDNLKEEFVQNLSPDSAKIYLNILKSGNRKEIQFNKNIYEFNINELEKLIKSFT